MSAPTVTSQNSAEGQPGRRVPGGAARWLRIIAVLAAGLLLYAASPPRDLWWLAPLAVAPFAAAVHGRRTRGGFGYGVLFGLGYMLPLLGWIQDFLGTQFGPWPWLGVALVEAVFLGLAGAGMARVSRLRGAPVWMAAVFVLFEALRGAQPFGGFPWGRLAFTQPTGPLLPLASVGGAMLVTFAVALIGCALGVLALRLRQARRRFVAPVVAVLVPLVAGAALWPTVGVAPEAGTARVATVQGNAPDIGLDLLYEDDVLHDNHIRGAQRLVEDVRAGRVPRPDLVVLPEQVGSWGPTRYDPELRAVTERLGVPVIAGGFAQDSDGTFRNRIVEWDPERGADEEYAKQHLVPFAETIPMRSVARLVSPFVDRFQQDMVAGDVPGVLQAGAIRLGVGLCYDVAYDDVFTGAAREGATLLAVPTNNAWYGHSEMSWQHLAMSRLRAVEHGRAVVVSATSGISAIIRPDGVITTRSEQFTAQNLHGEVPLRTERTLATTLGAAPTWVLSLLGVGALAATARRRTHDKN
ncbi:apolipoprotein N-acyltransferase [Saccharopolyspora sp. NFXS83]|uniref:apolipoprotein N-acyltransferase n=1 Tax=Saccharopolyspora sp. NFXS83 TaxID=2993560 RepID=UPI00224B9F2C|nr:apolipoprotein N-acyltransferase [Saccharopolyspora sp. NFXS83]MCX2729615.1 apolipoprotein N-acyltransferase [Saccharopolyspora sp. NFXS83]